MSKKELRDQIQRTLDNLFPDPAIPLYHKDAYTLLIAVLLSAQCTDERVNKVTPALFALADNPCDMVKLPVETIEQTIKTCGLAPSKSKAIWKLSNLLNEKHGGKVPNSFEALEELPGVGHKSASVVMAQAFGEAAFPIDTHIYRCAHRWGISSGKTVEKVEADLKKFFPKKTWIKRHLQIIYFARKFCPAKKHRPETCPICQHLSNQGC